MVEAPGIKHVPATVQILKKQLRCAEARVRVTSIDGLPGLNAPEEPVTDCGIQLLDHENWYVRHAGAALLGRSADAGMGAVAAQKTAPFLEHRDRETQRSAANALVGIATERPKDSPEYDPAAAEKMQPGAEVAAAELAFQLSNEDAVIRKNVLQALARIGNRSTPHAILIGKRIADSDLGVRNEVIRAIAKLGPVMTSAADCIALELDNESEIIRRSATKAIVTLEPHAGSEAAKAVASMLSNSSDTTKRAAALCLAELGKHTAPHGKALAVLLESEDVGVRNASVRALVAGGRGMASSMSTLMKKLDHPNEDVRRAAVAALRGLAAQCSKFTKTAHKLIEEEPSVRHHCQALEILGGSETYALPHLSDIVLGLEDKEWKVRRAAIDALEDLGPHAGKAGGEVARRLLHDNPDTRRAAAEALGRMGQHAGDFARRVEGLVETEKDEDVKRTCESAVARLNAMDVKLGKVPVSTTTGSPVKTKTKAEARSERKAASKPEKAKTEKKPADKSEAKT